MRTSAARWSSTLTPSETLGSGQTVTLARSSTSARSVRLISAGRRGRSEAIRPGRLVSTWKVCRGAAAIIWNTAAMKASGTSGWNRSLRLLTNTRRGRRHRSGWSRRSGCSTTPVVAPGSPGPAGPAKRRPWVRKGTVRSM